MAVVGRKVTVQVANAVPSPFAVSGCAPQFVLFTVPSDDKKATVLVGELPATARPGVTVAVKVTNWVAVIIGIDEVTVTVVLSGVTASFSAVEILPTKFPSVLVYVAMMG